MRPDVYLYQKKYLEKCPNFFQIFQRWICAKSGCQFGTELANLLYQNMMLSFFMLKQNSAIVQTNYSKKELESKFENNEDIIIEVYDILDEYDRLTNAAEIEMKKLEVNQ